LASTEQNSSDQREYRNPGEVRTYVIHQVRMTAAQRRAYEELYDTYAIAYREERTNLAQSFPHPERELILEVGFGMGRTTAEIAAAHPDKNYVGIEVHKPGVGRLLSDIAERGLSNLRIIQHDAVAVLQYMAGENQFSGVHIFFPDPWPKKRHHKRRLIQPGFLDLLASRIKPGGYFYVVTDWEEYADQILEVVTGCGALSNQYEGFAPPQAWRPKTEFERKGVARNHTIKEVYAVRHR